MPDRWTVGNATITAVVEEQTPGVPADLFFPDATADAVRERRVAGRGIRRARRHHLVSRPGVPRRAARARHARRSVRRQCQGTHAAVLEPARHAVDGASRRHRCGARSDRPRRAHASPRGPRRLGHAPRRRRVAADVHERAPPLRRRRARVLAICGAPGRGDDESRLDRSDLRRRPRRHRHGRRRSRTRTALAVDTRAHARACLGRGHIGRRTHDDHR